VYVVFVCCCASIFVRFLADCFVCTAGVLVNIENALQDQIVAISNVVAQNQTDTVGYSVKRLLTHVAFLVVAV
jgi:hypothetical protein